MTRCSGAGRGLLLAGLMSVLASAACDAPRDSIIVDEGMVTVENQTAREWRKVRVTVNDHFSGGVDVLLPGGRLNAPLSQFQTGSGRSSTAAGRAFSKWKSRQPNLTGRR